MNCLPFLVKSYIDLSNLCNSGQKMLRKLTIPAKLLQPFGVVSGLKFYMASSLFSMA